MKWSSKQPQLGDTRWILKFAWFPKSVGKKGLTVWLEKYVSQQEYTTWKVPGPMMKGTRRVFDWKEVQAWVWAGKGISIITNQ